MSAEDTLSLIGRTVGGHFVVEGVVHAGAHSLVYRALHKGPDEPVALRVLTFGGANEPGAVDAFVKRWKAEMTPVTSIVIGDPQLVRTIELGTAAAGNGTFAPFAAVEWVEGKCLAEQVAAHGPRSLRDAMALLQPVAGALSYAHRSGVAHGSLSSRGLFTTVTEDGPQLRLLDLGMWVRLAELVRETPVAASLLVSAWAAPEHLEPTLGDVGLPTDVFSLALIVAEVVRGKSVVPGDAPESIIRKELLLPRKPKDIGLNVGAHADRVLARALLRDPNARWPDVAIFWNALQAALADDDAGAPASWPEDHDTAKRFKLPADLPADQFTPTGKTPTGMTPTGPTAPNGAPASGGGLPDFDDGETTEMPSFDAAVTEPLAPPNSRRLIRQPDDDDLTPVQFTSSQRQRAAKQIEPERKEDDTDERPPFVPPPAKAKATPSERRRAAKPGDPPPEVAGTGRATGLRVMKPPPAAQVEVNNLPSIMVDDGVATEEPRTEDKTGRTPMPFTGEDDTTVVQFDQRPSTKPPRDSARPPGRGRAARSMPPPAPARRYGVSGRRARERRQLLIVGLVVFLGVAVVAGLVLGLRVFGR